MVFLRYIITKTIKSILGWTVRIRAQKWYYLKYKLLLRETINGPKRQLLTLVISVSLLITRDKQIHKSIEHVTKQQIIFHAIQ